MTQFHQNEVKSLMSKTIKFDGQFMSFADEKEKKKKRISTLDDMPYYYWTLIFERNFK